MSKVHINYPLKKFLTQPYNCDITFHRSFLHYITIGATTAVLKERQTPILEIRSGFDRVPTAATAISEQRTARCLRITTSRSPSSAQRIPIHPFHHIVHKCDRCDTSCSQPPVKLLLATSTTSWPTMSLLPPDTIQVKRKRGVEDEPVDFLR